MPKNKGKGGKSKRKGKNVPIVTKELVRKSNGQEYGQVTKLLGSCRLEIRCHDGEIRLGRVKGKIRKRVWISKDDIVLVELRDYQDKKCDVIDKYTLQEIKTLKRLGEISSQFIVCNNDQSLSDEEFVSVEDEEIILSSDESSDDSEDL